MLNKSEMNLLNKVMESSIEFKMEAYKALEKDLNRIQQEIVALLGTKEVKYVAPVVPEHKEVTEKEIQEEKAITILGENIKERQIVKGYCGSCCEETEQYRKGSELVCMQCGEAWELLTYEEYGLTNEFHKEEKKQEPKKAPKTPKDNHKVSDVKKLINCGPSEGDNAVLFVEKRRDDKHLWYGQIRIDGYIRNFHWSNELPMPVIYGVESYKSLYTCKDLIEAAVKEIAPKELTLYDKVPDHPDFGGFGARQFLGAIGQGGYIYLSPEYQMGTGDKDIVAKGYVRNHAFIVRRDGEVFWRNYNYIFSKKPFESTPSKGYDLKGMCNDVEILFNEVCNQYDKAASAYFRKDSKRDNNDTKVTAESAATADISHLF